MSTHLARRLAWLAPVLSLAFALVTIALQASIPAERLPPEQRLDVPDVLFALTSVAYAVVGALIATRHPRNAVGWLFCTVGIGIHVPAALWAYAMYDLAATSGGLPAEEVAAWLSAWSDGLFVTALAFSLLLFPNGRFASRRWRVVGHAAVALTLAWAVALAVDPGPLYNFETVSNPVGIQAAEAVVEPIADLGSATSGLVLLILAVASVVIRHRRADAVERQQIKWLVAASAFAVLTLLIGALAVIVGGAGDVVTSLLAFGALAAFPVAAGIAILRYRLYDIDVVVNRTLVYGVLTATLAGAYLGSVLLLQLVLRPLTEESDLAIAGSTLAVAALFRPARSRIQALVDRRFYRRKYDAAQTLAAFSARLREEVELDTLSAELRKAVSETMQPAHVSLWLRKAER